MNLYCCYLVCTFNTFFSFKAGVLVYLKKGILYVHITTNLVFYWLQVYVIKSIIRNICLFLFQNS